MVFLQARNSLCLFNVPKVLLLWVDVFCSLWEGTCRILAFPFPFFLNVCVWMRVYIHTHTFRINPRALCMLARHVLLSLSEVPASIFKILSQGLLSCAGWSWTSNPLASVSKAPPHLAEFLILVLKTQLLLLPWTKWPTPHFPEMAGISSASWLTLRLWQTLSPWNDRGWVPPRWRAGKEVLLWYEEAGHALCGGVHRQSVWIVMEDKNHVFLLYP